MKSTMTALALCAAMLATPGFAQSDEDKAAADAVIARLAETLTSGDLGTLPDLMAPKMIEVMGQRLGTDPETTKETMRAQMEMMSKALTFRKVEIGDQIDWAETDAGVPYGVIMIDSVAVMGADPNTGAEMSVNTTAPYVVLKDGDAWFMVEMTQPENQAIFFEAYPGFAGIDIPEGKIEMVQ